MRPPCYPGTASWEVKDSSSVSIDALYSVVSQRRALTSNLSVASLSASSNTHVDKLLFRRKRKGR